MITRVTSSTWLYGQLGLFHLQSSAHTLAFLVVLQLGYLDVSNSNITGALPSMWSSLEQVRMLLLQLLALLVHSLSAGICDVTNASDWSLGMHLRPA